VASVPVTRRFDLTDGQWALLEALLPKPKKAGRPSKWSKRQLIDGIRWRVRVGAPWRDVPDCYGHWRSVYGLYRRWQRDGTWARILAALQGRADALGLISWDVSVDSTIARAHQHAAGARRCSDAQVEPPGGVAGAEPDDHALGRSRGGLTTKLHLACEQDRKVLAFVVTGGQRGDSPQFTAVLQRIRVPRSMAVGPGPVQTECWPTRRTAARPTGPTYAGGPSSASFPSRPTRPRTAATAVRAVAGRRSLTSKPTVSGTPWSAASTC
jgi:transposase